MDVTVVVVVVVMLTAIYTDKGTKVLIGCCYRD